jgi:hypothetical protein
MACPIALKFLQLVEVAARCPSTVGNPGVSAKFFLANFRKMSQILTLRFSEVCGASRLKIGRLKRTNTGCLTLESHVTASHRKNVIQGGVQNSQPNLQKFEPTDFVEKFSMYIAWLPL